MLCRLALQTTSGERVCGCRSEIEEAEDDMAPLAVTYDFTTFENLGQHIGNKVPFDVLGVVKAMGELGTVKRKNDGSELVRRDVTLLDSRYESRA